MATLRYYGGKHLLAPWIVSLFPPHKHYVEAFAGGLAVLLAKDPEGTTEVANDLYGELINFYQVLRDPATYHDLRRTLDLTMYSRQEFTDAQNCLSGVVERAAAFFVLMRQSFSGNMSNFRGGPQRYRGGMGEHVSAWISAIEGLPELHERLSRVLFECQDACTLMGVHDSPDTLFYCDPPYLHSTRTGGERYSHEFTEQDHKRFLAVVRVLRGKVAISGYPSELYDTTLRTWNRHTADVANKGAVAATTARRMTEVVWTNF